MMLSVLMAEGYSFETSERLKSRALVFRAGEIHSLW